MGAASSAELKGAQATIRRLALDLDSAQKRVSEMAKEPLADVLAKVAERRAAAGALSLPILQEQLEATRREAETHKAIARAIEAELQAARDELLVKRDELQEVTGLRKFELLEKRDPLKASGAEAKEAALLVAEANRGLLEKVEDHAVFGSLLHDFGFKKVYKAAPLVLWSGTTLWQKQRAFRDDRAVMIAKSKAKSNVGGWPGAISIVEAEDGIGAVVDGQHRLGAAHVLASKFGGLPPRLSQIIVEVYPHMADLQIAELFAEINKAEPVALIDLPATAEGGATDADRQVITTAAEQLKDSFPDMFKPTKNCRAPHVNVDSLRDELHAHGAARRFTDAAAMHVWLLEKNRALGSLSRDQWLRQLQSSRANTEAALDKALAKAAQHGFYLGLTWRWLREEDA
mmetsp:Transcript_6108/g.19566  ORF Transcript_6108/g.19566 Transcript_6108/m.19566 type:complete len:402 (-) Transcript_6108:177-1382(-)